MLIKVQKTKTTTSRVKVLVFDRLEEDMPLFLELFQPQAKECATLECVYETIENPSFFEDKHPLFVRIDTPPKKIRWDLLKESEEGVLLFFSKVLKDAEGIECHNFSGEKPWERQTRIYQWIERVCQQRKCTLQKDAFDRLFRITEGFGLSILRHVEQILLTLKTSAITLEVLESHNLFEVGPSDWERARELLFRPKHTLRPDPLDMIGFISKLRQEVYYNLFAFESEPKVAIPPFRKKELKENEKHRLKLGIDYFYELLPLLLEVEIFAKSGSFTQEMLFDLLFIRIYKLLLQRSFY
ncbi:MAG: hypothetical protein ACOYK9_02035 [Chlamydiia bacterium]